jgi:hypothetical protein
MNGFDPSQRTTKFTEADQGDAPTIADTEASKAQGAKRAGNLRSMAMSMGNPALQTEEQAEQKRKRESAKRY